MFKFINFQNTWNGTKQSHLKSKHLKQSSKNQTENTFRSNFSTWSKLYYQNKLNFMKPSSFSYKNIFTIKCIWAPGVRRSAKVSFIVIHNWVKFEEFKISFVGQLPLWCATRSFAFQSLQTIRKTKERETFKHTVALQADCYVTKPCRFFPWAKKV